jgi:cytochrome c553
VKRRLVKAALLLAALGVVGLLVAASGVVPVKASAGHWRVTQWLLLFSMRRSIATHSLGVEVPRLDQPGMVLKGAGHYATGCAPCHGSPGGPRPRIPRAMLPRPEDLAVAVPHWDAKELFTIVKHGVKLTGMPAWPALQRDDEVWAMVAFLRELPRLDAEQYRALVGGAVTDPASEGPAGATVTACQRCHGADGLGRGPGAFPRLAGQRAEYLAASLRAFAHGSRHSGIMEPIAVALSADEIEEVALYYAGQAPAQPPQAAADPARVGRGRAIALEGVPSQDVPRCAECHGPSPVQKNPAFPVLSGQDEAYLVLQLQLFKEDRRGGTTYARLMRRAVAGLTTDQMLDVAAYYASQGP